MAQILICREGKPWGNSRVFLTHPRATGSTTEEDFMATIRNAARTTRIALLSLLLAGCSHGLPTKPASAASAVLMWTTPSDAGGQRIVRYDLRVSSSVISGSDTLQWWNSATVIPMTGKTPATPGAPDSVLIAGLTMGARYYAVLRSADGAWNWSSFSNVASFIPS